MEFLSSSFVNYIDHFFSNEGRDFVKSFSTIVAGMMHSCSCSTGEISASISYLFDKSFSSADKQIRYFLNNDKIVLDDKLWRSYIKLIFAFLSEGNYINTNKRIFIQIDHTTIRDDFLILYASIVFRGKAVPIYFTKRKYPNKKNNLSILKMNQAFIRGLRHILSNRYQYVIVGDAAFGTDNITSFCEESGFEFIFRMRGNINITHSTHNKIKDIKYSQTIADLEVKSWKKKYHFFSKKKGNEIWYLISNLKEIKRNIVIREYERRFKIEKCFFDQKSNGFNIEKTKITKYANIGRLLFAMCLSQALMLFTGDIIKHNHHSIKKTFPETINLILAFSSTPKGL